MTYGFFGCSRQNLTKSENILFFGNFDDISHRSSKIAVQQKVQVFLLLELDIRILLQNICLGVEKDSGYVWLCFGFS